MTTTDTLERELMRDLEALGDRLADERLVRDLYRALTNHTLHKDGGHLSLSWQRADDVVNSARSANALPPVEGLAQSGGEGELPDRAAKLLQELGWDARPLNTGRHDDRHQASPESPPPADRTAPSGSGRRTRKPSGTADGESNLRTG
jgi:hypothetical protein